MSALAGCKGAKGGQALVSSGCRVVYYLHGDHLGSTSLTTDSTGGLVSKVRYHPYGEACPEPDEGSAGATAPPRPTSAPTAQRHEAGFGLMDYNARYYSPSLGRFISPDSIVPDPLDSQTFNRYAYGYNNPLKYTDPSGHSGGISDFLLGVTYEVTSNNYDGLLIPSSSPLRANAEALATSQTDNIAFQSGRIVGGIASAVQGTAEIIGGAGTFVGGVSGGIITSPTGVGIAAGVGVAAVGAGVAAHGAGTFFHGVAGASEAGQNIFKAVTGGGGDKPPNLSPPGAGRNGAFRQAKRDMGIPVGQEPSRVLPNTDRRGELQPGRVYEFEVPAEGGGTKMIRIREDSEGHFYGDNDPQNRGPHFNTPDEGHYDY